MLTETWLRPDVSNSEILCSEYNIFRKDRAQRIGGGVLIAVRQPSLCEEVTIRSSEDIDFICVSVKDNAQKIFITSSYIPPNSPFSTYMEHAAAIQSVFSRVSEKDSIFVCGDFNLPYICWTSIDLDPHLTPYSGSEWTNQFLDSFCSLPLYQINGIPNANNRMLDLIFTDMTTNAFISRSSPISVPEDMHHPCLEVYCDSDTVPYSPSSDSNDSPRVFCFRKTNFNNLLKYCHNLTGRNYIAVPTCLMQ